MALIRKQTGLVNADKTAYLAAKTAREKQLIMKDLEARVKSLELKVQQLAELATK